MIGIAVGVAVVAIALVGAAIVFWCKKRSTNAAKPHELQPAQAPEFQSAVAPTSSNPASQYQSIEVAPPTNPHYMSSAPDGSLLSEPTNYAKIDDV